jgi:hypothetical protein
MSSHQETLVEALEEALKDAKSGRLIAFAFAGVGHDEHVLAYSFDDNDADAWWHLIGAVDKVRGKLVLPAGADAK